MENPTRAPNAIILLYRKLRRDENLQENAYENTVCLPKETGGTVFWKSLGINKYWET